MEKVILELKNTLDDSTVEDAERLLRSFYRTIEPSNKRNWKDPERLSWEIFAEKDKIGFYVVVPKRLERLIKSRIMDAYPQVEIKEAVEDYTLKFKDPFVAKMDLHRHFMYATRINADDTVLNSVLNSMSRLEEGDRVLLQISMIPINNKWQGIAYNKYRDLLFHGKKPEVRKSAWRYPIEGLMYVIEKGIEFVMQTDLSGNGNPNTPIERAELKATQKKLALPAFNTSIRIAAESQQFQQHKNVESTRISEVANSFIEMDADNEWRRQKMNRKKALQEIQERKIEKYTNNKATTLELAPLIRMPNKFIYVPELTRKLLKTLPIPKGLEEGFWLGKGLYNSEEVDVFTPIPSQNASQSEISEAVHPWMITGPVGAGKTTTILNMALARAIAGYSVIIVDTQGDMSVDFFKQLPKSEWDRVSWLNFGDLEYPVALDMMETISLGGGKEQDDIFVKNWAKNELVELMKKIWGQNFGPQTEYITRNNITATLETGGSFLELFRMLLDDEFREEVIAQIRYKAPFAFSFWRHFQDNFSQPQKMRAMMPSVNKIGSFVEDPALLYITSQGKQNYSFREMMDQGRIVVVTIPKGTLIGTWQLLGSLVISKVWLASLSRNNVPIERRKPAFLFCDEAEDLINNNFPTIISQSRKYRLGLVFGFQYLNQIKNKNRKVYDALVGNRPNILAMKIAEDAEVYADLFKGFYTKEELALVPSLHGIARLSIKGELTTPFTMRVCWNYHKRSYDTVEEIQGGHDYIQSHSRKMYAKPLEEVQKDVENRYADILSRLNIHETEGGDYEEEASDDLLDKLRDFA